MSEMRTARERPILFSAPMVRAILAGTKTQTRRVLRAKDPGSGATWVRDGDTWTPCRDELCRGALDAIGPAVRCPFGRPVDRIWVREAFAARYFAGGRPGYRADWTGSAADVCREPTWTPSIHMPRALSRITLEITDVRVERLQDISEDDARAEGFPLPNPQKTRQRVTWPDGRVETSIVDGYFFNPLTNFCATWNALNGKRAPWSENPWLWVLTFRRVETP